MAMAPMIILFYVPVCELVIYFKTLHILFEFSVTLPYRGGSYKV